MTNNQNAEEVRGLTANAQPLDPSEIIEYLKYVDEMEKNKPHSIDARLLATIQQLQTELHDVRSELDTMREIAQHRGVMTCPKCRKLSNHKFHEIWNPSAPLARIKCGPCGEWSTLDEWLHNRQALAAEGGEGATAKQRHVWDRDGERCVNCGAKDWMDDPECTPPDEVDR